METRPQGLLETLDSMLVRHVAMAGVLHCLPFLWTLPSLLPDLHDEQLKSMGIKSDSDRAAIIVAVQNYLLEKKLDSNEYCSPTAPAAEEPYSSFSEPERTFQQSSPTDCIVCMDLDLYGQLVCYPQEVIPIMDIAINEMFFDKYPAAVLNHQIHVRPFNVTKTKSMRMLNPEDIDQLITICGMIIQTSNIIPEMREAFKCIVCSFTSLVEIDRGRISEPTVCTNCNNNYCFSLIHNRSHFFDKQMIKLQESPDDMPAGQTPHTVVLFAHNDLVNSVSAGDRVAFTGIYRASPVQIVPRTSSIRAVYGTHIDVVHFRKQDS